MFIAKIGMLLGFSFGAGYIAADHIHSYMLGFSIAALAVGACYLIAFASTKYPQFAMGLLLLGTMAKLTVTVVGVGIGISFELISSPLIFSLSYLFYLIAVTYLWFSFKDSRMPIPDVMKPKLAS
ncbi:NADH:ubiquinone oxidoreductase [Vibrio sp. 10N.286.49.C2]|uniref:NADH:ubiquinone oxidoreductase n=1 Tax=unclassified Vibrio TaxID=2614977 RepID=UPI000C83F48C|nr:MULTISPECIES: NADH:ubiquinone oxidoreductase [unclassified Vibrio]PMH38309.1 NADH:ubiquinone oxidoreductase [Vibrio sp. 10N.286.49.C2]PMH55717.1 NADH:ubiquinone oxidoreductase [Vibrio sp. 10N.286.49.B1]PMH79294.1 NADH:ubiquinone oxidoreductase [Vibrio sp. 10N.286.48.B7]